MDAIFCEQSIPRIFTMRFVGKLLHVTTKQYKPV